MSGVFEDPTFWVAVGTALFIALLIWRKVPGMVAKMLNQSLSADYFIVPRGRVLFDRQREMGFIYHGNSTGQSQLQRIAKLFGLSDWESAIDDHYLMGNAADELFSDE